MNHFYTRVIPRDLFNEANLLKCLGRLSLLIHEGIAPKNIRLDHSQECEEFQIYMNMDSGEIGCINLIFYKDEEFFELVRPMNSKDPWPLFLYDNDDEVIWIFDDDGNLSQQFIKWAKQ